MCGGLSCCGAAKRYCRGLAKRYCRGRRSGIAAALRSSIAVGCVDIDGQTAVDEARCGRLQPPARGVEEVGGLGSGPGHRQQLARQAGVEEQELAPFVHEMRSRGERDLVAGVDRVAHDLLGVGQPPPVRSGKPFDVPRPPDQAQRVAAVAGQEALGADALGLEQQVDFLRPPWADPRCVVELCVPQERQPGAHPVAAAPLRREGRDQQVPDAVPVLEARAVDAHGGVVESAYGAWRERISRAFRQPDGSQPPLANHPRNGCADGRSGDAERCEQPHQGGNGRLAAAAT